MSNPKQPKPSPMNDEPRLMFLLAVPHDLVRPVFDHLRGLPPGMADRIMIAGCGLDEEPTPPGNSTPNLPGWDTADTSTEEADDGA